MKRREDMTAEEVEQMTDEEVEAWIIDRAVEIQEHPIHPELVDLAIEIASAEFQMTRRD